MDVLQNFSYLNGAKRSDTTALTSLLKIKMK